MCGLAGYFGMDGAPFLAAMSRALAHRGPDGDGEWIDRDAQIGLAHRRLAILDASAAAAQPMISADGRYVTVFNGEIYNFRSIGAKLLTRGYRFNPSSDTAVLAPLYDLSGPDMLHALQGMFAFAIYDRARRELFIARDSFGVKPLYYALTPQGAAFASEIKALTVFPALDKNLDAGAVADYLARLWSAGERTPLRSVRKLPPGYSLTLGAGSARLAQWSPAPPPATQNPHFSNDDAQELCALFDATVAANCVSDAPVGAFLSGGVDSSAIVAAMCATGHAPRQTYCIGFDGPGLAAEGFSDDLEHARAVARQLGVSLREVIVAAPSPDELQRLPEMLDEPQADPAALYVEKIAQAARADGVKTLLSGAGGDDIFTGYRRHQAAALRARLPRFAREMLAALLAAAPAAGEATTRRLAKLRDLLGDSDDAFLRRAMDFTPRAAALDCLSPEAREAALSDPPLWLDAAMARTRGAPLIERLLDLERRGFLPDHNLNYTDKATMRHGVEARVPFLDETLLAFAQRIPWERKIRGLSPKWAFKRAMATRLPRAVLTRRKTGFGGPLRLWTQGPTGDWFGDIFASRAFRERGLYDAGRVDTLFQATRAGRADGAYLLFALATTELWMRRFLDGPSR